MKFLLLTALFLAGPVAGQSFGFSTAAPAAAGAGAADYTFKGDNQRRGFDPAPFAPPLNLAWTFRAGKALYSSPLLVSGTAYFGSESSRFYAVNASTGALVWKTRAGGKIYGSSPAFSHGTVFVCSIDGCLNAFDARSGNLRWRNCPNPGKPAFSSPLVQDGLVYFGTDNRSIYAVDADSGATRWSFTTGGIIHDNAAAATGTALVCGSGDGWVYALQPKTGALLWKSKTDNQLDSTPLIFDGAVFIGSTGGTLYRLNLADGKKQWSFNAGKGIGSSPSVDDKGHLVFGSGDGKIFCLDPASGGQLWMRKTNGYLFASPLIVGGVVYIGSFGNKFYALDVGNGAILWSYATKGGIYDTAAVADGNLLIGDRSGALYGFKK
jgi:outer membrane protein assembly factor BamB